jgi:hyperosmotically inducible protein
MIEDAALTGKIKAALLLDERIGALGINVNTVDRMVSLEGTVASAIQRTLAEEIACLQGAREVNNRLEVSGEPIAASSVLVAAQLGRRVTTPEGAPPTHEPDLEESVRRALAEDRRENEHLLVVQVENNTVFLSGRQGDVDAHNAAVVTAAHVPGVAAVEDDIEIIPAV